MRSGLFCSDSIYIHLFMNCSNHEKNCILLIEISTNELQNNERPILSSKNNKSKVT